MTINLADVILENHGEFNGHKDLHMNIEIKLSDGIALVKDLQRKIDDGDYGGYFMTLVALEIYSDEGCTIVAKDYWDKGEHELGHRDKLLCSFSKIVSG